MSSPAEAEAPAPGPSEAPPSSSSSPHQDDPAAPPPAHEAADPPSATPAAAPASASTEAETPASPPRPASASRPHQRHAPEAARQLKLEGSARISDFEKQRKMYFGPQIHSNGTHWHAFAATLHRAHGENERVLEFFHRRMAVEQKYADALAELPFVDLKGGGGWRKGRKGSASSAAVPPPPLPPAVAKAASGKGGGAQAQQQPDLSALRSHYRQHKVAVPAMEELMHSMDALVGKYQEYVAATKKELLEGKLKALVTAFKTTSDGILGEGGHALDNVRRAEAHVQAAYAEYTKAADALALVGAINAVAAGAGALSVAPPQPPAAVDAAAVAAAAGSDLWLLDMQYRVAVELQRSIWAETQQQLHDLFTRMKTLELNRRQQLHGLILRFMQNQGGFWGQLPPLAADYALRISGLATDPQAVESELAEEIRAGAKAFDEQQQQQHSTASGKKPSPSSVASPASAAPPTTPSSEPFTGHLRSPLDTPLVKRVEVLEHRLVTGVESLPLMKRWRPTLAVLTVDNYLHLFDLPASASASASASAALAAGGGGAEITPKEAFKALVPNPLDVKGRFKRGKDVERIHPTASLSLDHSKARYRPEEGPAAFDVTESVQNSGFVKVFKSHETKRVTLKARTQERMVDWCVIVNGTDHSAS